MLIENADQIHDHPGKHQDHQLSIHLISPGHKQAMVGRDDVLNEIMDKLTRQQSDCRIIPTVGMGGIGKTTLVRNVYENPLTVEYFDICAWVTVSQEYNTREILLELVCPKTKERKEALREIPDEGLGEMLYKTLCGRRYLIVMDDIWSTETWNNVKLFFPNNNSESRIMVTNRLANLAWKISGSRGLKVNFLDKSKSWDLFCNIVFGEEDNCPLELEETGKTIVENCKGLPLSVIVIGGLLAKSEKTQDFWEYIAENLSSVVNLEDNERCLRILYMSYKELPVHLKPCFLYMGVFPKDNMTYVSRLKKLWVAEGFLKSISGKSLEEAAEEYLNNLIDRNLIVPLMMGSSGKIKLCSMHDLLRDLCLREAQKEKFLSSLEIGQATTIHRRIVVHQISSKDKYDLHRVLHSAQLVHSLTCDFQEALPLASFRLLRIIDAPPEIWKMHQLRHLDVNVLRIPDPTTATGDEFVLPNLQKMSEIVNFKCCEAVVKRIPNINKLRICYNDFYSLIYCLENLGHSDISSMHYCLENLGRFQKL
ncbi:UNVERIFIED_CONTAM: putative late blight resistance proteinR1A-10 [Sesamum angustifolium]|uniref:Late blight resistance proteinR1A-10 n=1 Tax=Sesamum angustifolium TaxID=2727405 RepID=A0AAW2LL61_9LAMI